jgi:hypothetical protein
LVSDIPTGEGKIRNLFLQCRIRGGGGGCKVFSLESWIISVGRKGKGSELFDFADLKYQRLAIWDQRI